MSAEPIPFSGRRLGLAEEIPRVRDLLKTYLEADSHAGMGRFGRTTTMDTSGLDHVCRAFRLSGFEREVLLACAGIELDATPLAVRAQGSAHEDACGLTVGLAMAALPNADWLAFSPAAPLRCWRLVELSGDSSLSASVVRLDEGILHAILGAPYTDDRLRPFVTSVEGGRPLPLSQETVAAQTVAAWRAQEIAEQPVRIELWGESAATRQAVASEAGARQGYSLMRVGLHTLRESAANVDVLARLLDRDSALRGTAWLLETDELSPASGTHPHTSALEVLAELLDRLRSPLLLSGSTRRGLQHMPGFELRRPSSTEDCRDGARAQMNGLAMRIEPLVTLEDVVLPTQQKLALRAMAAQVRGRSEVLEEWGFSARGPRGLGLTALFAGSSGTGKTMAAEALARELGLDMYRIDLGQIVSKYIGDTEKNLGRVFDGAALGGSVLFFDEADALFGKRSEVRDSHDRYANIEVSYLLQRLEAHNGLVVLATNLKANLDPAFLRRIRFVLNFPFPDAALREELWRKAFPAQTPTEGLDAAKLARLGVAGGNIHSIALNAAFLAWSAGEPVRMAHLLQATRQEYAKLEKPLTDAEIRGWV